LGDAEDVSYKNRCAVWQTSSTIRHRSVNLDRFQSNGASSGKRAHRWLLLVVDDDSAAVGGGTLHPSCRQSLDVVVKYPLVERWRVRRIQCPVSVVPRPSSTTVPMSAAATFDDDDARVRLAPAAPAGRIAWRCVAWGTGGGGGRLHRLCGPRRRRNSAVSADLCHASQQYPELSPLCKLIRCALSERHRAPGASKGNREGTMTDRQFYTATPSRLVVAFVPRLCCARRKLPCCVSVWQEHDQGLRHPTLSEGLTLWRSGGQGSQAPSPPHGHFAVRRCHNQQQNSDVQTG
jgi:hypothetical protein